LTCQDSLVCRYQVCNNLATSSSTGKLRGKVSNGFWAQLLIKLMIQCVAYGIAIKMNNQNFRTWNSHGHATTLAIDSYSRRENFGTSFFSVCCGWHTFYS